MPARPYKTTDGARSWIPVVEFANKGARDRFQAAALAAIDAHMGSTA
jgi:hypothetical protein